MRAGKNGAPEVTDGPFAEAKEFLAGYWIVDVDTPERAYAIAAEASAYISDSVISHLWSCDTCGYGFVTKHVVQRITCN